MLAELDVARAKRWVAARNASLPPDAQAVLRYELDVTDRTLTLLECRPPWQTEREGPWTRFPIVRFRYTATRREWSTLWRDRNLRFHPFEPIEPSSRIADLLAAVDEDRTGIFWG